MRQTNRVKVSIGADSLRSKAGSSSLEIGGWQLTGDPEYTYDGKLFWKEIQKPSRITTTLVHCADTDLNAILATRGIIVTFRTDTGLEYSMNNALLVEVGELSNGEVTLTFAGEATTSPTKTTPDNPY